MIKAVILVLWIIGLAFLVFASLSMTARADYLRGDANQDGVVNDQDVYIEVQAVLGIIPLQPWYDVDFDGLVTMSDVLWVIMNRTPIPPPVRQSRPRFIYRLRSIE